MRDKKASSGEVKLGLGGMIQKLKSSDPEYHKSNIFIENLITKNI